MRCGCAGRKARPWPARGQREGGTRGRRALRGRAGAARRIPPCPQAPCQTPLLPVAVPFLLWQATDPYLRLDGLTLLMRPKNSGIGRLRADPRSGAGFGGRRLAGGPARGADGRPRGSAAPPPPLPRQTGRPEVSAERRGRKRNLPRALPLVDRLPYHSPGSPRLRCARLSPGLPGLPPAGMARSRRPEGTVRSGRVSGRGRSSARAGRPTRICRVARAELGGEDSCQPPRQAWHRCGPQAKKKTVSISRSELGPTN